MSATAKPRRACGRIAGKFTWSRPPSARLGPIIRPALLREDVASWREDFAALQQTLGNLAAGSISDERRRAAVILTWQLEGLFVTIALADRNIEGGR